MRSHVRERLWLAIIDLFGLSQELDWIKIVGLFLLLLLEMLLSSNYIGVQSVISLILDNILVIGWIHVSGLVAVIGVEWWIGSLVRLRLQLGLLLDLLLVFLFLLLLLWLSLLLLVFGRVLVHVPGAFLGLLILEVSLCVSDVLVEWQANWVLDNLGFFLLGPGPWLAAPARGRADWIRFGAGWTLWLLSSLSLHLLLVSSLGSWCLSLLFLLGTGMALLPLLVSDQSRFLPAVFIVTMGSGLGARVAFLPLLVGDEAGLLPLRACVVIIALALSKGLWALALSVGVRGGPLEILDQG